MGDAELIQEVRDIASCADYSSTRKALFAAADRLASLTNVSEEDVERVKRALAGLSTPMMGGDNLAIVLCSCFENPDQKPDGGHGWTPDAVAGYEEVIDAAARAALTAFVRG